jgi:hypothetical protein
VPLQRLRAASSASFQDRWDWDAGGGRLRPIAIDVHPSGIVAGIEGRRHRVFLVEGQGSWIGFAEPGGAEGELGFAQRIFARCGLQLYTLDPDARTVDQFDLRGSWESRLEIEATAAAGGEEISVPVDLCLDRAGELFLLDAGKGRVLHIDRAGMLQRVLGTWGDWVSEAPLALEVDGRGRLYLLEGTPPALLVLAADGHLIERRDLTASGGGRMHPSALAVDQWGNAFVADRRRGAVGVYPVGGGASWWIDPPAGEALRASDLAVDDSGRLLVADAEAAAVWVYALTYATKAPADASPAAP